MTPVQYYPDGTVLVAHGMHTYTLTLTDCSVLDTPAGPVLQTPITTSGDGGVALQGYFPLLGDAVAQQLIAYYYFHSGQQPSVAAAAAAVSAAVTARGGTARIDPSGGQR